MSNDMNARRPTIISPTGHIRSYARRHFVTLVLMSCILAFVAGYINALCVQGFIHLPVSATTGMTTRMMLLSVTNSSQALYLSMIITSFVSGNTVSGALVGSSSFRLQRAYSGVLLLESTIISIGYLMQYFGKTIDRYVSSLKLCAFTFAFACGLQNGMCTTFSDAVIRTTHVTGILTDIGLIIGQAIFHSRTKKHLWKLKILVPLYLAFCLGVLTGYFAFEWLQETAILFASIITLLLGFGHWCYRDILPACKKQFKKKKDIEGDEMKVEDTTLESSDPIIDTDESPSIDYQEVKRMLSV